jgi:hypothetical protein
MSKGEWRFFLTTAEYAEFGKLFVKGPFIAASAPPRSVVYRIDAVKVTNVQFAGRANLLTIETRVLSQKFDL